MKRSKTRESASHKRSVRRLRATIKAKEVEIARLIAELRKARALLSRM